MFSDHDQKSTHVRYYEENKYRPDTPSEDTDKFNPLESRDGSYIIDLTTKMQSSQHQHLDQNYYQEKEFTPIQEDSEAEQISSFPSSF